MNINRPKTWDENSIDEENGAFTEASIRLVGEGGGRREGGRRKGVWREGGGRRDERGKGREGECKSKKARDERGRGGRQKRKGGIRVEKDD